MMNVSEIETDSNFNVYSGTETGIVKGIYFGHEVPQLKNFHSFENVSESKSISALSWIDETQKELLVSFKSQIMKIYNTKLRHFTSCIKLTGYEGKEVVAAHSLKGSYLIGLKDGQVNVWDFATDSNTLELSTGNQLSVIRQCTQERNIFATGGNENNLKIWNAESSDPKIPIYKADNLPHDELDLRRPVWIQDLTFMPMSYELVTVCTRYGQVMLYDPKVKPQNKSRPAINIQLTDHPLMSISTTLNNRQVLVGSSQGKISLLDLRNPNKAGLVRSYAGFSGSIRSICAHPEAPYFVSCGLDRHLYLHHLDQKKPLKKLYLKSRLTCAIMADHFKTDFETIAEDSATDKAHWQNIDMATLDVGQSSSSGDVSQTTPKKRKVKP